MIKTPALEVRTQLESTPSKQFNAGQAVIWPLMGVSSWGTKHGGACRLYWLARTLDPNGSGHIQPEALKQAALNLKVNPRTFYSWLADAIQYGIFEAKKNNVLRVHSQETVAIIFGCQDIDKTRAIIPLKALFSKGWRAHVWAAYIKANHNGKPISHKKLEAITGVSVYAQKGKKRLQRYVKCTPQIGITRSPASLVPAMNEYTSHGKAFVFTDPQRNNEKVAAIHLPSVKTVSDKKARTTSRGRRTVILASLEQFYKLACTYVQSSSQADNRVINRLFYSTPKKGKTRQTKDLRALTQTLTRGPHDPKEIFLRRGKRNAWDIFPVGIGVS